MKSILTIATVICLLQSCAFSDDTKTGSADSSMMVYQDTSITAANAYSDLFLDSSAVSSYIQSAGLDTAAAGHLRNFYLVRNYQFAWFNSTGMTEEGRSFWPLVNGTDSTKKDTTLTTLRGQMDSLVQRDSLNIAAGDSNYRRAELALTHQLVLQAGKDNSIVTRENMYYLVPRKKMDPLQLADSILNKQKDSTGLAANKNYAAMKQQLALYYNAAKNGGWQPLAGAGGLKKGLKSPAVTALKKRLQSTGDYAAGDTTNVYSDSLVAAIKEVQSRHGLAATGNVNDSLVTALNVPAEVRVQQLLLNMNRLAWMPAAVATNRIEVNLPAQMLYVYEGSNKVMEMPVIVGKEGTSTVAFSGTISQVVFSPSWNIPNSIVKNEIMPAMKNDEAYLKKKNMEVVGRNDSVPVLKQLPGRDNPLGKVKFLFPNSFDIYLHDTPDKSLFRKSNRALSHGCIRVADAEKLAQYILRDQKDWTPEKIRTAMNAGKEETVKVNNAAPVQISNLSAWVGVDGRVHFRNDLNGRDKETMARLFTGTSMQDVAGTQADSSDVKKDVSSKPRR